MLTPEQEKWIAHLSNEEKITIVPWDSATPQIFEKVKERIQKGAGNDIKVFHYGASGLGISGQDEIDVYVPVPPDRFNSLAAVFNGFLGEPGSRYPLKRIRYKIEQDGKRVDVFLSNEDHPDWINLLKFNKYLKDNPQALKAYRILKERGHGLTVREYYRRKLEFINDILSEKMKVAVIGGGVIGLYISWKLSSGGYDVSVFDRKKEEDLGKKCCSTLVSERIRQFIPIVDDCVENIISSCLIHFLKKDVKLNFSPKHLVLNRSKVISILLDLNKKSGAKLFFGQNIKELPRGFDRIIGCDGALSITRKLLKLPDPKMKMGIQFFLEKENHSQVTETFLTQSGFCWQIPRGKETECGVLGELNSAKREMESVFKGEPEELSAALVPQPHFSLFDSGLVIPETDNITLCGDAMGLTKPWSGGGLVWGLYAADILVKTFPNFKDYKKEVERFFGFKIRKGIIANKAVHLLGRYFPYVIPSEIVYDNDFPSFSVAFKDKKW